MRGRGMRYAFRLVEHESPPREAAKNGDQALSIIEAESDRLK